MSRPKNRNSLLAGPGRLAAAARSSKDQLLLLRYSMDRPQEPVHALANGAGPRVYPDYQPWAGPPAGAARLAAAECLHNGYLEPPAVPAESLSARTLVHETLLAPDAAAAALLGELLRTLARAYSVRNDTLNRIAGASHAPHPPPRVTMTAPRRDAWLRDLADADVPLARVAARVPHGLRHRLLLDHLCAWQVPEARAVWCVKCVLGAELLLLRRRRDPRDARGLLEWTQQVADHVARESRGPPLPGPRRLRLAYLLRLVRTLYVERLVDRACLLACVARQVRAAPAADGPALHFGVLLTALVLVQTFWRDLVRHDVLARLLAELLLWTHVEVERVPAAAGPGGGALPGALPAALRDSILGLVAGCVARLFRQRSSAFILPAAWLLVGPLLFRVLAQTTPPGAARRRLEAVFRLVDYRNESLLLNMRYSATGPRGAAPRGRPPDDTLAFIGLLDRMDLRGPLATALRPTPPAAEPARWRTHVRLAVRWGASACRDSRPLAERVLVLCNYIKKSVLQPLTARGSATLKAEFEGELLDSIFALARVPRAALCMHSLAVLVNELCLLRIIAISAYLRKIIACGIFYISSRESELGTATHTDPHISFHLSVLANLPVLNNKQHYLILSKWTPEGEKISSNYARGMEVSRSHVLHGLLSGHFPHDFDAFLAEILLFSVGVKFLLANWLTSQIKSSISQSPKLIHLSPSAIARIYQFYVVTDNLTLFFRAFLRYVLKNEDKVIIFYLDTLHYVGHLLQHHYLLVNFLPGSSPNRISASYELFNLIISAYQDLASREPDSYDFRPLWEFINLSIDTNVAGAAASNQIKLDDPDLERYIFTKDTAESPLKVLLPAPRRNQAYSAELFVQNLNRLLAGDPLPPTADDISDYCRDIGPGNLSLPPEHFSPELDAASTLQVLLQSWYASADQLEERQDCAFSKLTKITMNAMEKRNRVFQTKAAFKSAGILDSSDCARLRRFLIKVIYHRILLFADTISMIAEATDTGGNSKLHPLASSLVFGKEVISHKLFYSESVMFTILQTQYRSTNIEEIFRSAIKEMKDSLGSRDSDIWGLHSDVMKETVMQVIISHKDFAISLMSAELPVHVNAKLCCDLLQTDCDVSTIWSCTSLAPLANEFSLPVFQLLLRVLSSNEHLSEAEIGQFTLKFMDACEFAIDSSDSYFGELFNYLKWEDKAKIFNYLELYFLTHRESLAVWDTDFGSNEETNVLMFSRKNLQGVELLPVFKDFFKKFSVSSTESLEMLLDKFEQFSSLLLNILELVDNAAVLKLFSRQLHDIISVFLRLLIIHSASLTKVIAMHDSLHFVFLKNMMLLLNSTYLASGQDKLKILLFDLLFQIKGSLTQALAAPHEDDIMGSSPQVPEANAKTELSPDGATLESTNSAAIMTMSMILNLPEPEMNSYDFGTDEESSPITLDDEEINQSSDVAMANDPNLVLKLKENSVEQEDPFRPTDLKFTKQFRMESVALIEDTTTEINSGCISLSMFGAYTTKENPY